MTSWSKRAATSYIAFDSLTVRVEHQVDKVLSGYALDGDEQLVGRWLRQVVRDQLIESGATELSQVRDAVRQLLADSCSAPGENRDDGADVGQNLQELSEALKAEETTLGARSAFARVLDGRTVPRTRRILQALFNQPTIRPAVLVAQSRVASEGLNLHLACRDILFLHLDWNPALIEQQIGRVDRVNSLWEREAALATGQATAPCVELATVVLEGTSDGARVARVLQRQRMLKAHLFGELLSPEIMAGLPSEWRHRLLAAEPRFIPGLANAQASNASY